ncbi:MAG TPA: ADP-glyceromanno-heptose 6-epimerase [Gammaproteobacteria bacterium]|nr:ADP-L-glycero-D-manno-heptose-6-epimerase [bacterium BMS3Abin11]HDH15610.1 ADP-glyceromanno-heptose 6-epimerase [Gammaproteobacteria bacterium]HDZ78654.1 ADP-glyceromanno-heptose 6-epimerase [Gammaproteobacteria bacterium]
MIIVTGGAGFIGANIVKGLNDSGRDDVIVVDNLEKGEKFLNLVDLEIADYIDKRDFIDMINGGEFNGDVEAIFHLGACSDTMEYNGLYMMSNNYDYSKTLLHFCQQNRASFIYASSASVYGAGPVFRESPEFESPLNVYAYSKFQFDKYVRRMYEDRSAQIVGLRYFNVYGDREQHKGRMASVAFHFSNQYRETGYVKLFEGVDGYENGAQLRDFVSVEDVVDLNLFLLKHPDVSGIFNVGTGHCQSFNDMAVASINRCRLGEGKEAQDLATLQQKKIIRYIDFPETLRGKYQSFTEADISALRAAGYTKDFLTVEEGVSRYVGRLIEKSTSS